MHKAATPEGCLKGNRDIILKPYCPRVLPQSKESNGGGANVSRVGRTYGTRDNQEAQASATWWKGSHGQPHPLQQLLQKRALHGSIRRETGQVTDGEGLVTQLLHSLGPGLSTLKTLLGLRPQHSQEDKTSTPEISISNTCRLPHSRSV